MKYIASLLLIVCLVSCDAENMDDAAVKEVVYKTSIEHIESVMKGSDNFLAPKVISDGITVTETKNEDANSRIFHVKGWFKCLGVDGEIGKHTYSLNASFMDDFIEGGATLNQFTDITIDNTKIPN
jgi:hypothetical protein